MRGGLGDLQTSALLLCLNDKDENRQISLQMDNPSFVFHLSFVYQTNPRQRGVLQYLCLRTEINVCTRHENADMPKSVPTLIEAVQSQRLESTSIDHKDSARFPAGRFASVIVWSLTTRR